MKNARKTLAALLLCIMVFSLAPGFGAEAGYTGQIDAVPITFSMPPVEAGDISALSVSTAAPGCQIASVLWYDGYGRQITDRFTNGNATVVITVNAAPGYFFSGGVVVTISGGYAPYENYGSQLVISKTFTPVIWAPNIVKHPGSETVYEGGIVSFVSLAAFTTESYWTIIDTEGKHYSIDKLAEKFPQLVFYTTYSKLNMGPIPMEMDGYKVRCTFTGPGGSVDSGYAEIKVEKMPQLPVGGTGQPNAIPQSVVDHTHQYSDTLSSDAGHHWYACDCGDANMKEEHDFVWIQRREATLDGPGLVQGECSVCGYVVNCRTQLDPDTVERLRAEEEAAAAPSPTPAPTPAPTPEAGGILGGILNIFRPKEYEYDPG